MTDALAVPALRTAAVDPRLTARQRRCLLALWTVLDSREYKPCKLLVLAHVAGVPLSTAASVIRRLVALGYLLEWRGDGARLFLLCNVV